MGGKGSGNPNARLPNGGGRPKGTLNKVTTDFRKLILLSVEDRGGRDWLRTLPDSDFIRLAARCIPQQVEADVTGQLTVNIIKFSGGK
jgi:hypothetical protein